MSKTVRGYAEVAADLEDGARNWRIYSTGHVARIMSEAAALLAAQGAQLAAVVAALEDYDRRGTLDTGVAAVHCVSSIAKAVRP